MSVVRIWWKVEVKGTHVFSCVTSERLVGMVRMAQIMRKGINWNWFNFFQVITMPGKGEPNK